MFLNAVSDWDAAYANAPNIPNGERWPAAWVEPARAFRDMLEAEGRARLGLAYGDLPRNRLDLFLPVGEPQGLVVYIHGGFWLRLDRSHWSHLARGPLAAGYAVAMPGYTLCPDINVSGITREIGRAIAFAAGIVGGPIRLTGHSAGGHLATRMVCTNSPLSAELRSRLKTVVSIAGIHDLRPMLATAMNETLKLDEAEAIAESPALLRPLSGTRLVCWAGASERAEFIRQNALLANVWRGLGAATAVVEEPDRHHFNIIDGLEDSSHPLTRALIEG
ncbi:MAG: alpha/beta hydrolase [Rhizobiaceae bacterium]